MTHRRWTAPASSSLLLVLLLHAQPARAEDDAISTDRPDFVESASVVGRGVFQIETSAAVGRDHGRSTLTTPTLLRLGTGDTVELRLETDAYTRSSELHGWADLSLGFKWHLRDGDDDGGVPAVALVANAALPSGSRELRVPGVRPEVKAAFEWELPAGLSLGAMPGVFVDRSDTGRRYVGAIGALTLARDLAPGWRGFAEVAAQRIAHRRDGGSVLTFDTGATWALSPDVQVDAAAFVGISRDAPALVLTTGLSIRFR